MSKDTSSRIEDIVMTRAVEEVDCGVCPLWEVMMIDLPSLAPVHVLHSDSHTQR